MMSDTPYKSGLIRKTNKLLSALLAVLILLSAMSVTAFAADGGNTTLTVEIPYTVTLQVGDHHGKVTVNSTDYTGDASFTAAVGTALTYTFTPNTLYKVDKVIYNGTDVTGELSGNTYTAPALAGNATLSVSFKFLGGGGTSGDPTAPKTGDNSHVLLWVMLLAVSGVALTGTAIYSRKRKYN